MMTNTYAKRLHQGKVRDTHQVGETAEHLLIVATDRISTHNVVHKSEIPLKGEILTALTIFWHQFLVAMEIPTHVVAFGREIYRYLPPGDYPSDLHRRAMVVRSLKMIPVEFIFRQYMTGSLWANYYSKGLANPYGIEFPKGMDLMEKFKGFCFTPTDKSETDEPLDASSTKDKYREAHASSLLILTAIKFHLASKGLALVDTKLEFGLDEGVVTLADEIVTPDSSRIVPISSIVLGQNPPWLDKQLVRDEAERQWAGGEKIPLTFSQETIGQTTDVYGSVFEMITGDSLERFQRIYMN